MNHKLVHRLIALLVFLISAVQFFTTAQVSVSFWDPGELSAAAYALEVPHPPGGPLFSLVGHFFYMLPIPGDPGYRMNCVSALSSAFSVLFLYLVAVRLIRIYKRREPSGTLDALGTYLSAAIGALSLSFCGTFWFNGTESNYFAASTFLFSAVTWLLLCWYESSDKPGSWKYFIIIAYLVGLAAGIHLMSVLTMFIVIFVMVLKRYVTDEAHSKKTAYIFAGHAALILLIALAMWGNQTSPQPPSPEEIADYDTKFKVIIALVSIGYMGIFWKQVFNKSSIYLPVVAGAVGLAIIYPGIIKKLPSLVLLIAGDNSTSGLIVLFILLAALAWAVRWAIRNDKIVLAVATVGAMCAIVGVTTYTMTIIRANQHPPMNENDPNSFSRLITYLNREQYGDFPTFKRRWSAEPQHQTTWSNYSSDLDFFWRYQMDHMFNRYVEWNFIGRTEYQQDAGVDWKQLYGIPFFIGLFGLYFHFRKDWKMASAFLLLFIMMGYLTAFYQNQQEWQPRDRDYFYAGAYFVFALWIALGIRGILDLAQERLKPSLLAPAFAAVLAVGAIFAPVRMFQTNYYTHDRSKNWLPWDYSYNLLQSCKPNAILFTNGDNDTFPLWYLQDVEGIRRDVRIVNLSLVNTEWYIKQLKNETPYGTAKIKMSLSDDQIDRLQPIRWKPTKLTLSVPRQVVLQEVGGMSGVVDTAVYNSGAITFTMPSTLQFGDVSAIRVQDIMVREIIQYNAWERPIYFANTCGDDTKIGLGDYVKIEGYAGRLVPQRRPPSTNPMLHYYLDDDLMRKNLLDNPPAIAKTYQTGFLFRGLNDKSVFYDENEERMAVNSRGAFMMLATSYLYGKGDKAMCVNVLHRLNDVLPRSVIKLGYRESYQTALIYNDAGDTASFRALAQETEATVLDRINQNPSDLNEINVLYQIMTDMYERTHQYKKAADLLEGLLKTYPDDPTLKREIERYRSLEQVSKPAK